MYDFGIIKAKRMDEKDWREYIVNKNRYFASANTICFLLTIIAIVSSALNLYYIEKIRKEHKELRAFVCDAWDLSKLESNDILSRH